ncbi:MAG: GGDEF domain-containing protein [Desulfobacterales bacterium]|nr:GGDEF domain-containing protein [Desulfobacterales bacterium]
MVDTHGHLNGSQALREVARTIRSAASSKPCFGVAYGGDEFVARAARARQAAGHGQGGVHPQKDEAHELSRPTAGCRGAAERELRARDATPRMPRTSRACSARADQALFRVKQTGQGRPSARHP